jgi:hypothetical protein
MAREYDVDVDEIIMNSLSKSVNMPHGLAVDLSDTLAIF